MCGICGFFGFEDTALLKRMTKAIQHRGPGKAALFTDGKVSLGYQRLSIIDLDSGRDMVYGTNRTSCITYNGELYNYKALKAELEQKGHKFYTARDTEVVLHAYEEYGPDCLQKFNGCYAFAIWDAGKKELFLARDRLGIKPLYYTFHKNQFLFSSEIKSILQHEEIPRELNQEALYHYLSIRYNPTDETFFKNIYKLPPASYMIVNGSGHTQKSYWSYKNNPQKVSESEALAKLKPLLESAVEMRLMSDVPLGAFLSGGIDSSTIAALMGGEGTPNTFSVGFEEEEVSETANAKKIAEYLGTNHRELFVKEDTLKYLPQIIYHLDEPVSDASAISVFLMAKLAKEHVTVTLAGYGADEVFSGYPHHNYIRKAQALRHFPVRNIASAAIRMTPLSLLDKQFHYPASMGKDGKKRLAKYISTLKDPATNYASLISVFSEEEKEELYQIPQNCSTPQYIRENFHYPDTLSSTVKYEIDKWIPSYVNVQIDKATLANALELRVPFLDHRIVELAGSLPTHLKLHGSTTKYIFRKSMQGRLPKNTIYQEKHPLYAPIDRWFEKGLKEVLQGVLEDSYIQKQGLFKPQHIQKILNNHQNSRLLYGRQLWALLTFEIWNKMYIEGDPRKPNLNLSSYS